MELFRIMFESDLASLSPMFIVELFGLLIMLEIISYIIGYIKKI